MSINFSLQRAQFIKWFLVALLIKSTIFSIFIYTFHQCRSDDSFIKQIFTKSKDNRNYYIRIENLIDYGIYGDKNENKNLAPDALRMPGHLPVYGTLYYFLGYDWAHFSMILLQVILDALSVVLLAICAGKIFNAKSAYYIAFFTYATSTYVSVYNHYGMTESLCTSAFIFSFYFFLKIVFKEAFTLKNSILCGIFLCWAIFLRPAMIIFLFIFPFILFIYHLPKINYKIFSKTFAAFVVPSAICLSLWTYRNYHTLQRFIPLCTVLEEFYYQQ